MSDKLKGADGKECWKGYRHAGTTNGKDKCVKVEIADSYCSQCLIEYIKKHESLNEYITITESGINEAEYRGRKVKLGKPMRGDVKKFKVYVKNPKGNVVKVNFGHGGTSAKKAGQKTMRIRKNNPKARKSFRARHKCDTPGPRHKARYWSCRKW
jgi:hypothetical protein